MRRICSYFLAVLPILVAILVGWLLWPERDHVLDNFNQITKGMTRADVVAIMGRESDTEREALEGNSLHWNGLDGVATVVISNETERVTIRLWTPHERAAWFLRFWWRLTTELGI